MSAPHQSERDEIPTTLDIEAPVPSRQTGSKTKSQCVAPKAKKAPKSAPADLQAPAIDKDASPSLTPSVSHKRGRPKGSKKGPSAQVLEPVEEQKETSQPTQGNVRTQTKKDIPHRSPLPQRTNRNTHPGKPVMPRPKRSSAEVIESKAKKAAL
jgi:hypothetical protein